MQIEDEELRDERAWDEWYDSLSPAEREELEASLADAPLIAPQKGPQENAFLSDADVMGYGGAAGGGKSALIAILCLLEHEKSVIYRQDKTQLNSLVNDLVEFHGSDVGLNRQAGIFRFGDRKNHEVEWGGLGKPQSEVKWKGRPHDLIAFDEVTEMPQARVDFVKTWLRTATPGQRTRVIMTFNPPGGADTDGVDDGYWVVEYFAPWLDPDHPNPAVAGELRYFIRGDTNEEGIAEYAEVEGSHPRPMTINGKERMVRPESRTFIPATLEDNLYLTHDDQYVTALLSLPEPHRSRMLDGRFDKKINDSPSQVIPTAWIDEAMRRWRDLNFGQGDYGPQSALGVDVARGGADATIIASRHGLNWKRLERIRGIESNDGPKVAAKCIEHSRNGAPICIDAIGVGSSPLDFLSSGGANTFPIVSNARAESLINLRELDKIFEFTNVRAALWWLMRCILDPARGLNPALPDDRVLRKELRSVRYELKGQAKSKRKVKLQIESKAEIKERLGHSTDAADAILYSAASINISRDFEGRLRAKTVLGGNPYAKDPEHGKESTAHPFWGYEGEGGKSIGSGKRGSKWMAK